MNTTPRFLIATDLSDAAAKAIECAAMVAKPFNAELILLHIFEVADVDAYSNKLITSNFLNREIKKQLQNSVQQLESVNGIKASYLTKDGSLFDLIAEGAEETKADILFIGTHGIKGVQHITGSFIAKAINEVTLPVWIVQKESNITTNQHIFVYVDALNHKPLHSLSLQLATFYHATIHFVFTESTQGFAVAQMIKQLKTLLDDRAIVYDISHLTVDSDLQKEFLSLASKFTAPLLVINRAGKAVEKYHEEIITNRQHFSVLCLFADEA